MNPWSHPAKAGTQVGPAGHVVGIDMTAETLAKSRATAHETRLSNVEFREGLVEEMPHWKIRPDYWLRRPSTWQSEQ